MTFRAFAVLAALAATCALGAVGLALAAGGTDSSTLFASMNGANEINANTGSKGAGDPDGAGGSTVTFDGTDVCFGITVKNLDSPVAAHIHLGNANENGPVVVTLAPPADGDPGASSGCVTGVDSALAAAIMANPSKYYVNVHTAVFPGGAVRGQLFKK
jgi:hypothetical protein